MFSDKAMLNGGLNREEAEHESKGGEPLEAEDQEERHAHTEEER